MTSPGQAPDISVLRHGSAAGSIQTELTQVAVPTEDGKRRALSIEPPPGVIPLALPDHGQPESQSLELSSDDSMPEGRGRDTQARSLTRSGSVASRTRVTLSAKGGRRPASGVAGEMKRFRMSRGPSPAAERPALQVHELVNGHLLAADRSP